MEKQSVFSFLTSYVPTDKREAKEDYLTQMFAWMLVNIDGYAESYVKYLCLHGKHISIPDGNKFDFSISTQETLPSGRIDLLIRVNHSISFICEHKVHSELSENQIKKYMDNSELLGSGQYFSVLVTFSRTQHTQPSDVALTWSDICELTEGILHSYEHEDAFMLQQFVTYLKENGMGKSNPIEKEALLGYWPANNLEYNLNNLFSQMDGYDWVKNCPGLKSFSSSEYAPCFSKMRWGRIGIDFFPKKWSPGLFAGVLLNANDHQLPPIDTRMGPDFVIFMESVYAKNDPEIMKQYQAIISSPMYKKMVHALKVDSGSFQFLPGIEKSPWRIAVLRKPLYDVLENAYTKDEQLEALKDTIEEGLQLLIQRQ